MSELYLNYISIKLFLKRYLTSAAGYKRERQVDGCRGIVASTPGWNLSEELGLRGKPKAEGLFPVHCFELWLDGAAITEQDVLWQGRGSLVSILGPWRPQGRSMITNSAASWHLLPGATMVNGCEPVAKAIAQTALQKTDMAMEETWGWGGGERAHSPTRHWPRKESKYILTRHTLAESTGTRKHSQLVALEQKLVKTQRTRADPKPLSYITYAHCLGHHHGYPKGWIFTPRDRARC